MPDYEAMSRAWQLAQVALPALFLVMGALAGVTVVLRRFLPAPPPGE